MALGEVSGLWDAAQRGERCSCGEVILDCPVWSQGLNAVRDVHGIGSDDYADFASLTTDVLRTRRSRELSALQHIAPAAWPQDVRRYVNVIDTLFQALRATTRCDVLVDSSKLPPGFLTETLLTNTHVDVVHIVRDPRAVASAELGSLQRGQDGHARLPPGRSLVKSTVYWSLGNLAVRGFAGRADSRTMLRYEDLAQAPALELQSLANRLGLAPSPVKLRLDSGHLAVGNPSRFDGAERPIRLDNAWQRSLTKRQRAVITGLSAPARLLLARDLRLSLRER